MIDSDLQRIEKSSNEQNYFMSHSYSTKYLV